MAVGLRCANGKDSTAGTKENPPHRGGTQRGREVDVRII